MPSSTFTQTVAALDDALHAGLCFDLNRRSFLFGGEREAVFYTVAGFSDSEIIERLFEYFLAADFASLAKNGDERAFISSKIPFGDASLEYELSSAVYKIACGASAVVIDGFNGTVIIDARKYSGRSIAEPDTDRVLRGPRDGFIESLVTNASLIRRRIRDSRLVFEKLTIGASTRTDVVLCYLDGHADERLLRDIKGRLKGIKADAINMGQESIAELIVPHELYNPFPKIRYTERPDAACAMVMEGSVVLLCDNYPAAMILPTSIFTFLQDTDDFYFSPITGTYLKLVRTLTYLASLILPPLWYLFASHPDWLPGWVSFVELKGEWAIPLILQILAFEIIIDGLKLASLNTPSTLSNSLSMIGGLLLGNLAISVGLIAPQVILYMSFVTVANFAQPSYELGYAFKIMRMITLVLVFLFSYWGLIAGALITLTLIATTKTVGGRFAYLYPLIPWNGRAMFRLWFRARLKNK